MNLITYGPDYAAGQVKLKIIARRERMEVYVPEDGRVLMTTVKENEQRATPYPDDWLIGLYGKGATTEQIRDDLDCRLTELRVMA